ncbi:hypothetical protein CBR_g21110 [Chara braunii]|uniref:DNA-directed primase/polymerase protein n=1 Tax=Chara braunii TaxID=69332 RepID=A0A388L0P7_CHABU|nr:hypothetical protein CBR_g21110 [Chara braunii]|eukprot:GBG75865.1 hypothetical protein CBR_g21110 [Chara braunii]
MEETEVTEHSTKRTRFTRNTSDFPLLGKACASDNERDDEGPSCDIENVEDKEERVEDDEAPNSQVWDELVEIALEQVERAASRWGSNSLGRTVQTFSKADAALAFVDRDTKFLCPVILAYELPAPLSGFEYAVMGQSNFLSRYKEMSQEQRVFYELIHPKAQCHLYFDLEFSRPLNTEKW